MADKIWKGLLLAILAAGVAGYLAQVRYTLVPTSGGRVVEYDRFTGHTRVGEVAVEPVRPFSDELRGQVVWFLPPAR